MNQQNYYKEMFYSRQVAALGQETQLKLEQLECFIYGLRGLGLEIAKNLILMGLKRVTICDRAILSINDLATNFYVNQDQLGNVTREGAVIKQLQNLNENVIVEIYNGVINGENLKQFSVVVLTDTWDQSFITEINEATRLQGKGFILAHSSGLFGSVFVDFSDKFVIYDNNGENEKENLIERISNDNQGLVKTLNEIDERHQLQDGDQVKFKEVLGMTEINDQVFKIKVLSPQTFSIGDTSNFSAYQRNGIAVQVKIPEVVKFNSFQKVLSTNQKQSDQIYQGKVGNSDQMQIAYKSLLYFMKEQGRIPDLLNENDAESLLKLAQQINIKEGEINLDVELIKNVSYYCKAQIAPLTTIFGGIVAQEVVKFTGKLTPIRQWLHLEFFEALPESQINRTLMNCQYDDYIAIFGQDTLNKLQNQKILLTGVGGLGNEFLKMFSLMGLGSGQSGQLIVVDDDQIELPNLNGQFLFNKNQIGFNKANIASQMAKVINQTIKCEAFPYKIQKSNGHIFNQSFWNNIDFTVNAVDNIQTRKYLDSQCCNFKKPTFESGADGTKCHSQIILPFLTESFSETHDPPEISISLSTYLNFPSKTQHNILWAKYVFQQEFEQTSLDIYQLSQNPGYLDQVYNENKNSISYLQKRLNQIEKYLQTAINPNLENFISLAIQLFNKYFYQNIKHLLAQYPIDHIQENGQMFWANQRRCPEAIEFDGNDQLHLQFIQHVIQIVSKLIGNPIQINFDEISSQLQADQQKQIQSENHSNIEDQKEKDDEVKSRKDIELLIEKLKKLASENHKTFQQIKPYIYPKNNLTYLELNFLTCISNLQAKNYKLPQISRHTVQQITENIIPSLITTKAVISGIVGIEIFKYIQQKDINVMRNAFINLALPLFVFSRPNPPFQHQDKEYDVILCEPSKAIPDKWTAWDVIKIDQQMTVGQLIEYFEKNYGVKVYLLGFNSNVLYSKFKANSEQLLQRDCAELYAQVSKETLPQEVTLEVVISCSTNIDGQELSVDLPPIWYHHKA